MSGTSDSPPLVLIADDEATVRRVALRALQTEGYRLLEASDGHEALRVCQESSEPVMLALLDIIMPGMNGMELLNCLRELYPGVRVLFMSGYPEEQAFERAGLSPQDGRFLRKPFTAPQLRERIRIELAALRHRTA